MGWLKWREFGRRGDTARDQVIQVFKSPELKRARGSWHHPDRTPKQVPTDTPAVKVGPRGKKKKVTHQTSDQRRLPAEFKHITKRRRRN